MLIWRTINGADPIYSAMKKLIPITLLLLFALMQSFGCSFAPYQTSNISKNPSLVHFDMNNPPFDVKKEYVQDKGKTRTTVIPKYELGVNKTFSIKYHRSFLHSAPKVSIPVEFPNGGKYAAYLDTGSPVVVLTSDVVLDNKLAILPIIDPNYTVRGICHIPVLFFGSAQIKDSAGYYTEQQWQFRFLNIPVYKYSSIILGCSFIRAFDYVLFNNVDKEVILSKDGAFKPDNPQLWMSFPYSTEGIVQIPIAGQMFEVAFDSCGSAPGLNLNKTHWQAIEPNLNVKRLVNFHVTMFQGAHIPGKKATVSEISIGGKKLKNADVIIYDDPKGLSVISLGYFQDTIVVLDFVNNLFWIKK